MQAYSLSPVSGEFKDPGREAAFLTERFAETRRHVRLLFILSVILNSLFFLSDWRFEGTPHFIMAIPARAAVVAISLICWFGLGHVRTTRGVLVLLVVWQAVCGVAISVLVSSRSDIALFVVVMLPSIYYLVASVTFRWTLISGIGCSILMLAGYISADVRSSTNLGLVLAMLILNAALILVVTRSNRLSRLEWAATQAERQARQELAQSRRMFEDMFMAVPVPLLVTSKSDGRLLKANDAALAYFRGGADDAVPDIGSIGEVYVDPNARAAFLKTLGEAGRLEGFEIAVRLADGSVRDVLLSATSIEFDETDSVMAGVVDITSRKALEQHLKLMATTDSLTGLANRRHFLALAKAEIERSARYGHPLTVLMIDIDHFKRINDTFGHETGDRALQAFAELLNGLLRQQDIPARLGGEEFAVLLPETDQVNAVHAAERLRQAAERLSMDENETTSLSVSVGVAAVRGGESGLNDALSRADRALYVAKNRGRNTVVVHTEEMMDRAVFSAYVKV